MRSALLGGALRAVERGGSPYPEQLFCLSVVLPLWPEVSNFAPRRAQRDAAAGVVAPACRRVDAARAERKLCLRPPLGQEFWWLTAFYLLFVFSIYTYTLG